MDWTKTHSWIRSSVLAALAAACCAHACNAAAADIPWPGKARFRYVAQKKDLRELLREFGMTEGITVALDDGVEGSVSGKFDLKPQAMLDLLASSYGFIWYYDGSLLHIMPASSVRTEVIPLRYGSADQLEDALERLGVLDRRYPLHASDDGSAVVISGPASYVELVQKIAQNMEGTKSRNQATEVRVFPLKYAWAGDHEFATGGQSVVVTGVASVLRSMFQPAGASPRSGLFTNLQRILPARNLQVSDANGTPRNVPSTVLPGPAVHKGGMDSERDPADSLPVIQADPRINAVLIRDIPSRMDQYASLIKSLDIRPTMIEIEARIIEVNTDEVENLGVDWRLNHTPTANAGNSIDRLSQVRDFMSAGGVGKAVLENAGLNLVERIAALAEQGKASITASPTVLTLNNLEAHMDNTQQFFVRVAGHDNAELFNVSAGVTLRVTPMVISQGNRRRIKLEVRIEDGQISGQTVDQIPVVKRSEINTEAFVNNGEALLIAGYSVEQDSRGEAKVPGLSEVPVVGGLFRHQDANKTRMQRLFLLTPRIVEEEDPQQADEHEAGLKLAQTIATPVPAAPAPQPANGAPAIAAVATVPAAAAATPLPPPVAAAPTAAPPPLPEPTWDVTPSDRTLRTAMARWARTAGWQLMWELPYDYELDTHSAIHGSFEHAVEVVARSMADADPPLRAIIYSGNKVVRIVGEKTR